MTVSITDLQQLPTLFSIYNFSLLKEIPGSLLILVLEHGRCEVV